MAPGMVGGNLADMDAMSKAFGTQAEAVAAVMRALEAEANKVPASWSGPNADRFKAAWNEYKSTFIKVQTTLKEAQQGIAKNKQAIASATGS
ncbi:MAG: WXG100 family type VII secretion target [Actinomadura sp.]